MDVMKSFAPTSDTAQVVVNASSSDTAKTLCIFNRTQVGEDRWNIILNPNSRMEQQAFCNTARAARFFDKQGYASKASYAFTWEDFKGN